jgi:prepilin peptidase CpaA
MDVIASTVATAAVSLAAAVDVRWRRIPNWLCASLFLFGVVLNVWRDGAAGGAMSLAGAAVGLALLLPFYMLRAIGAGDVKLLAALGALLGPQLLVSVVVYGALAGGVMSLVILLVRGRLFVAVNEIFVQHRAPTPSGATAPYGVAIASGVYLSMLLPGVLG